MRRHVAILACFWMQTAWAQEPPTLPVLTLEAALSWAQAHHPDMRSAALERDASRAAVAQAGALPNPELSTLLEDTRRDSRTTTVQLSQTIELGGKRAARLQVAEQALGQASTDMRARGEWVRAQVVSAFHEVALAQDKVRLSEELEDLARGATQAASRRVAAGKVSPVEEVKAQVAQARTRAALAGALSEWRSARQQLVAAMGDPSRQFDRVEPWLDQLPTLRAWSDLSERVQTSPTLVRAQQEVQRRQALTASERARQIPDLTVSVGVKRDAQLGRDQPLVGLSLSLPIFDRNQGALTEAQRREDKARVELESLQAAQQALATRAFEQLSAALAEIDILNRDVLPGASQALQSVTKGYELGKFGFIDVLDAQRTFFEARSQALQATSEAFMADARLRALLGEPTTLEHTP